MDLGLLLLTLDALFLISNPVKNLKRNRTSSHNPTVFARHFDIKMLKVAVRDI